MRKRKQTLGAPTLSSPENKLAESHPRDTGLKRRINAKSSTQSPAAPGQRHTSRGQRSSLRAGLAVLGGRAAGALSRRLHVGGGTSVVGIVAQRFYPDIVNHLASQLEYGSITVTGTNGKTTTSGFIAAILSDAGLRVWRNREGSNLMGGVASALVMRARPTGRLRRGGRAISILEIDEAVMPQIVRSITPRVAVFTNLFRDQLDRYGEVDTVATLWRQTVGKLPATTTLVLNADDPTTAYLGADFAGEVLYFGIDDPTLDLTAQGNSSERHQVIDTRTCPRCGGEYIYTARFYSHMGHYSCANCGLARPKADVRAVKVRADGFDRLRIQVETPTQQGQIVIPLPGLYNIYNALAAITTASALQLEWSPIVSGIEQFKPAFGRGERVQVEGRTLRLLLAKNPAGFNEVLRTLFSDETPRHVLFVLNDNIADGRDISWIWDVDFERALGSIPMAVLAGTRAFDLALRLKYAGFSQEDLTVVTSAPLRAARQNGRLKYQQRRLSRNVNAGGQVKASMLNHAPLTGRYGIAEALNIAIRQTPVGETLFIVPTYTALLEVHRELERRGLTPHYWDEKGP